MIFCPSPSDIWHGKLLFLFQDFLNGPQLDAGLRSLHVLPKTGRICLYSHTARLRHERNESSKFRLVPHRARILLIMHDESHGSPESFNPFPHQSEGASTKLPKFGTFQDERGVGFHSKVGRVGTADGCWTTVGISFIEQEGIPGLASGCLQSAEGTGRSPTGSSQAACHTCLQARPKDQAEDAGFLLAP